jgi:hypothetical protein
MTALRACVALPRQKPTNSRPIRRVFQPKIPRRRCDHPPTLFSFHSPDWSFRGDSNERDITPLPLHGKTFSRSSAVIDFLPRRPLTVGPVELYAAIRPRHRFVGRYHPLIFPAQLPVTPCRPCCGSAGDRYRVVTSGVVGDSARGRSAEEPGRRCRVGAMQKSAFTLCSCRRRKKFKRMPNRTGGHIRGFVAANC